jgi:hypothetical protein
MRGEAGCPPGSPHTPSGPTDIPSIRANVGDLSLGYSAGDPKAPRSAAVGNPRPVFVPCRVGTQRRARSFTAAVCNPCGGTEAATRPQAIPLLHSVWQNSAVTRSTGSHFVSRSSRLRALSVSPWSTPRHARGSASTIATACSAVGSGAEGAAAGDVSATSSDESGVGCSGAATSTGVGCSAGATPHGDPLGVAMIRRMRIHRSSPRPSKRHNNAR